MILFDFETHSKTEVLYKQILSVRDCLQNMKVRNRISKKIEVYWFA